MSLIASCSSGVTGSTESFSKQIDQRVGEAVHAITMLADVLALDVVQHMPDFVGRVLV